MSIITRSTYDTIASHFAEANSQMPDTLRDDLQNFVFGLPVVAYVLIWAVALAGIWPGWKTKKLRMVGADFSIGMLAEARKVTAGPLIQMDMRSLAFADSTFDGIWCNAALLHLPKIEAAATLQEMHRILRSGAILGLAVQQGEGEAWETNPYTQVGERFFARYSIDEMTAPLVKTRFSILDTHVIKTGQRNWLRFTAKSWK